MPDGSERHEGFLLKWWSELWEQTNGKISWMYVNEQLEEKLEAIREAIPELSLRLGIAPEKRSLLLMFRNDEKLSSAEKDFIEKTLQVRVHVSSDAIFLYFDEPKYVFPKWIRNPISACPVCMSSPFAWGGLMWAAFLYFNPSAFLWAQNPVLLSVLMVIPFCVSLAFMNYLIGKNADF